MYPLLIDLGTRNLPLFGETHLFLPSYGVLFAGAVVLAWWWFSRRARTLGIEDDVLFNLGFYTLLAGILGAKLLLVAVEWKNYLAHPELLLGTLRSAGVLAGGVIMGALAFVLYCRRKGLPFWELGDAIVAPLVLAQAVGRLGCFAAGCCWGVGTHADHPLAVVFTAPFAGSQTGVPLNQPLIGTQPIQFSINLAIAAVLTWMWRRRVSPPGTTFWTYVLLYSVGRGTIEFWRGDKVRGLYFGDTVSTTQLILLVAFAVAATMLLRGIARRRQAAAG